MVRIALVSLVSFLPALLAALGLDAYTAGHPVRAVLVERATVERVPGAPHPARLARGTR